MRLSRPAHGRKKETHAVHNATVMGSGYRASVRRHRRLWVDWQRHRLPEDGDRRDAAAGRRADTAAGASAPAAKPPLRIAYSDWPGWTAFEIGIQKGWFKEAGVDVEFDWFEYAPSMEAFAAGKVDAVMMTNGDALVTGAPGARSVAILRHRLQQRQRHDRRQAGHQAASRTSRARRSASRSAWSSTCCCCKALEKAGLKHRPTSSW